MYNNPQSQVNYAHRATPLVAVLSKEIIKSYYVAPAKSSHFCGCSNGGKMALIEAERYPEDFDGIVGGGYVVDRTKAMMMSVWTQRALLGSEIQPYKMPATASGRSPGTIRRGSDSSEAGRTARRSN